MVFKVQRWLGKPDRWFQHGRRRRGRYLATGHQCRVMSALWEGNRLVCPPLAEGVSAFLQLHGKVSSWVTKPALMLLASGRVHIHGLAPSETGWFHFCLPPSVGHQASKWEVKTLGFTIDRLQAEIFCSWEAPAVDERILILAPHPDDAEIAAYGFYSTYRSQTWVLTLTCGQKGSRPFPNEGLVERTRRAEIRVAESLDLPVKGGISAEHVGNLMLADGGLETMIQGGRVCAGIDAGLLGVLRNRFPKAILPEVLCEDIDEATALLMGCLSQIKPDVVVCPHWRDTHADHRATASLVARVTQKLSRRPRAIYAYTVHPVYSELEPFGAEGTASAPPALLADTELGSFHIHHLDSTAMMAKKAVLVGISDLQDTEPEPSWWRDAWAYVAGSRHPSSYLRRAVRQHEWFEVFEPEQFFRWAR